MHQSVKLMKLEAVRRDLETKLKAVNAAISEEYGSERVRPQTDMDLLQKVAEIVVSSGEAIYPTAAMRIIVGGFKSKEHKALIRRLQIKWKTNSPSLLSLAREKHAVKTNISLDDQMT